MTLSNPKNFSHVLGKNPDLMFKGGKIWLTGTKTGGYYGKSYETGMTITDFLSFFLKDIMETLTYELKIDTEKKHYEEVSSIIGYEPKNYKYGWSYEVVFEEQKEYFDIIVKFLDSLEGNYEKLKDLGIENTDISIWIIYGYNNQCNMEFQPKILERLGDNGIKLCISCFEGGE